MKTNIIYTLIGFVFLVGMYFYTPKVLSDKCYFIRSFHETKSFNNIVLEKRIDYENHAASLVELNDGQKVYLIRRYWPGLYLTLEPGDSIVKQKGDSLLFLFKKGDLGFPDKPITFDLSCSEWMSK